MVEVLWFPIMLILVIGGGYYLVSRIERITAIQSERIASDARHDEILIKLETRINDLQSQLDRRIQQQNQLNDERERRITRLETLVDRNTFWREGVQADQVKEKKK